MFAAAVIGLKRTGKTALMGLLASALEARGRSVGVIKFTHQTLNTQHTDTFWLMRSGRVVAGIGPEESAMFYSPAQSFREVAALMRKDVVLIEGGKTQYATPRILCLKESGEEEALAPELALATVGAAPKKPCGPHFSEATPESAAALADLILEKGFILPSLTESAAGDEDCRRVTADILAGRRGLESLGQVSPGLSVSLDGEDIRLDPFAEANLRKILGALAPDRSGRELAIRLKG